jgi:hypothetical protein
MTRIGVAWRIRRPAQHNSLVELGPREKVKQETYVVTEEELVVGKPVRCPSIPQPPSFPCPSLHIYTIPPTFSLPESSP